MDAKDIAARLGCSVEDITIHPSGHVTRRYTKKGDGKIYLASRDEVVDLRDGDTYEEFVCMISGKPNWDEIAARVDLPASIVEDVWRKRGDPGEYDLEDLDIPRELGSWSHSSEALIKLGQLLSKIEDLLHEQEEGDLLGTANERSATRNRRP
jgi:hypothetical protein